MFRPVDRARVEHGRLVGQVLLGDAAGGKAAEGGDDEVAAILVELRQRFGTADPTEEELRSFLHDRLVSEGRTAEEADRFLAEMDEPDPD